MKCPVCPDSTLLMSINTAKVSGAGSPVILKTMLHVSNLDNTGLVRFVNGTLERIRRDGTWNTLYRKWLTVLGPAPAPPTARYVD